MVVWLRTHEEFVDNCFQLLFIYIYGQPAFGELPLLWCSVGGTPTTVFLQWHFHNSDSGVLMRSCDGVVIVVLKT